MSRIIVLIALMPLLLLASSELFNINGMVNDIDGLPIKGVVIKNIDNKSETKSDKNGKFKLSKLKIGDSIQFIHPLYQTKYFIIESKRDIQVVLEKKSDRKSKVGGDALDIGGMPTMIIEGRASAIRGEGSDLTITSLDYTDYSDALSYKKDSKHLSSNSSIPIEAGKLTAGEVNDYSKWNLWNDLTKDEFKKYSSIWSLHPKHRYTVIVKNESQMPIFGAKVQLFKNNEIIWSSVTDNSGKAELWNNPFFDDSTKDNLQIRIIKDNHSKIIEKPVEIGQGLNIVTIASECQKAGSLDIAFLIDATGSMGDEIDYLKADLDNIIRSIQDTIPDVTINLGISHYRDFGEEYLIKSIDLSSDINKSLKFLSEAKADGGGDYPEALEVGLYEVINNFSWNENSIAKVVFLILDAPPHHNSNIIDSLQKVISLASKKGIRIIPLTCSGIEKDTEFLMRSIALLTNGTYTFLTDHSGIGNPHIEPSTDKYEVETLNNLIKRLIVQYSYQPDCNPKDSFTQDTVSSEITKGNKLDNTKEVMNLKVYPNPSQGELNIELPKNTKYFFIADISGKVILRIETNNKEFEKVNLSFLPNGVYFVVCEYEENKFLRTKFIISR